MLDTILLRRVRADTIVLRRFQTDTIVLRRVPTDTIVFTSYITDTILFVGHVETDCRRKVNVVSFCQQRSKLYISVSYFNLECCQTRTV